MAESFVTFRLPCGYLLKLKKGFALLEFALKGGGKEEKKKKRTGSTGRPVCSLFDVAWLGGKGKALIPCHWHVKPAHCDSLLLPSDLNPWAQWQGNYSHLLEDVVK